MSSERFTRCISAFLAALPMFFLSNQCFAQAEQVLAEVGAMDRTKVVRPDFAAGGYTGWIQLAGENPNFRAFAISARGTALVLDGNMLREFTSSGNERITNDEPPVGGLPRDCTALNFPITKPNGKPGTDSLSSCGAFTPLNDGTIRIAGQSKGGGFVIIAYDPAAPLVTASTLVASGTPPSITDMDGDQFADSNTRQGAGYWAVGDRKKVIFFPLAPASPQDFKVIATINGVTIDSVTPFGSGRVVVALNTGELRVIDAKTGNALSSAFLLGCSVGRKDPQKYVVRGDPSGTLFAGNLGCRSITVLTMAGDILAEVDEAQTDELIANPFPLQGIMVESLDWQSGQGGDFADCHAGDIDDPVGVCLFGARPGQAFMWNVKNIGEDTSYRMFQFVDLIDCRWWSEGISDALRCPVINCDEWDDGMCVDPAPNEQVLDLVPLLRRADETGVFEQIAFPDGVIPRMLIPAYMRGEACYPSGENDYAICREGDLVSEPFRFQTFFAATDAIFTGNFFVDYKIDEFRTDSDDPCEIPLPESDIWEINETANLIVYNSDSFGTVDRGDPEGTEGGVIINDACNGRGSAIKWSAQTIGMELYDESGDAYVWQVRRMMQELKQAGTELLCSKFPDPDNNGPDLGPLLTNSTDCSKIASELDQMDQKLDTCLDSLFSPQSGNSAENCSAFDTKVQNLQSVLATTAWPNPNDPSNLNVLRPNYEGEFRSRFAALVFFLNSYVKNGVPPGGIVP